MSQKTDRQREIYLEQDLILTALQKIKKLPFVLSGGTALSRFYFHHRFSEDLDFFCEEPTFSFEKTEWIATFLRKSGFICELMGRTDRPDRLKAASYEVKKKRPIKVDFLEDPFSGMWSPVTKRTETGVPFRVDDLDQIYYRKLFSLLEQWHRARTVSRVKDLVDLYWLHRYHQSIEKTVFLFQREHVPVDEEKIIMILSTLKKKDVEIDLKTLGLSLKAEELLSTLKRSAERLLRKGLGR